jgi:ferritin
MEIGKKMRDALNKQINRELFSGYLYLSMAAYFEGENLRGFSKWMRKQATEEKNHAMKMFDFIYERGGTVSLGAIEAPNGSWKSPLGAFEEALSHEKKVTEMIYSLADVAESEKDRGTLEFLQWFIKEQVEEEATATEIVNKLKMVGDNKGGLMLLDKELGARE